MKGPIKHIQLGQMALTIFRIFVMFDDCPSVLSSHPVWFRLSVCGFVPTRSALRSAQQHHRDPTGCQKVCYGATQAGRRTG